MHPSAALGLIVVGDYALATGRDQHVGFVGSILGTKGHALAWAWMIPADRVQLASALHEALQRPHAVACFGGFGAGIDDCVNVTLSGLQTGREQVGLSRHVETRVAGTAMCGNVAFFSGHPAKAHSAFELWWATYAHDVNANAQVTERIGWTLPESDQASDARRKIKAQYPSVRQRLIAGGDGEVMLTFIGMSKGKAQGARKALQRALATKL